MVRLYYEETKKKRKEEFIDINIWSLVKAHLLVSLVLTGIIWGAVLIFFFLFGVLTLLV